MLIRGDTVVSLEVRLTDLWGNVLQEVGEPILYLHGGYDNIVPAVEAALEGKRAGDRVEVLVEPEEAFGDYDDKLLRVEPRERLPEGIEVGMQFEGVPGEAYNDTEDPVIYTVTDIAEGKVVLDGNHPLAGIALKFACRVLDIREANADELEQGYPDNPDAPLLKVVSS